ncbi:G-protein gamma-like domain, partial [Trinorchestia longiramus]
AEAQSKVDKKRDKLERKVLDSQERAFWDVHRPVPGCVNTTEIDIKKACRMNKPLKSTRHLALGVPGGRLSPSISEADLNSPKDRLKAEIDILKTKIDRCTFKVSKAAESYLNYFEQYNEYDPQMCVSEPPNPWISDSTDYWEVDKLASTSSQEPGMPFVRREIPSRRVRRWGFGVQELLKDPLGREQFTKFLEKEFSAENLITLKEVLLSCNPSTAREGTTRGERDNEGRKGQRGEKGTTRGERDNKREGGYIGDVGYIRDGDDGNTQLQELKALPQRAVTDKVQAIWDEFLAPDASAPVNIDSKSMNITRKNMEHPDRWTFDEAAAHLYQLMRSDSYCRYLRSDLYKDFLSGTKKKHSLASQRTVARTTWVPPSAYHNEQCNAAPPKFAIPKLATLSIGTNS